MPVYMDFEVYEGEANGTYFFLIPKNSIYLAVLEFLICSKYNFKFESWSKRYMISVELFDQESLSKFKKTVEYIERLFGEVE